MEGDFASTAATVRASIRRLRELTDHEAREPRRSITALAAAADAAAAAAEEARRAVEEAQRAEEREQEARRLSAELILALRTPEKVDCGLCQLADGRPRGAHRLWCCPTSSCWLCAGRRRSSA
jgi:Arc/MetJ-type ribon-helix-helix transcriptional regulator